MYRYLLRLLLLGFIGISSSALAQTAKVYAVHAVNGSNLETKLYIGGASPSTFKLGNSSFGVSYNSILLDFNKAVITVQGNWSSTDYDPATLVIDSAAQWLAVNVNKAAAGAMGTDVLAADPATNQGVNFHIATVSIPIKSCADQIRTSWNTETTMISDWSGATISATDLGQNATSTAYTGTYTYGSGSFVGTAAIDNSVCYKNNEQLDAGLTGMTTLWNINQLAGNTSASSYTSVDEGGLFRVRYTDGSGCSGYIETTVGANLPTQTKVDISIASGALMPSIWNTTTMSSTSTQATDVEFIQWGGQPYVVSSNYGANTLSFVNVNTGATGTFAAVNSLIKQPTGLAFDGKYAYVASSGNHTIVKFNPSSGAVIDVIGSGTAGAVDGTGANAQFNNPQDIECDKWGNLYVADADNHAIRVIDIFGTARTFAGAKGSSGSTNSSLTASRFTNPMGLALNPAGEIFVIEKGNSSIRKIDPVAKTVSAAFSSSTGTPTGITVTEDNGIYLSFGANHVISHISEYGTEVVLAGSNGTSGTADGGATAASFNTPMGMSNDPSNGKLYVADLGNNAVRQIADSKTFIACKSDGLLLDGSGMTGGATANTYSWNGPYITSNTATASVSPSTPPTLPALYTLAAQESGACPAQKSYVDSFNIVSTTTSSISIAIDANNGECLGVEKWAIATPFVAGEYNWKRKLGNTGTYSSYSNGTDMDTLDFILSSSGGNAYWYQLEVDLGGGCVIVSNEAEAKYTNGVFMVADVIDNNTLVAADTYEICNGSMGLNLGADFTGCTHCNSSNVLDFKWYQLDAAGNRTLIDAGPNTNTPISAEANYLFEVTGTTGCIVIDSFSLNVNDSPIIGGGAAYTDKDTTISVCEGSTMNFTVPVSNPSGKNIVEYKWFKKGDSFEAHPSATIMSPTTTPVTTTDVVFNYVSTIPKGIYTVYAIDEIGCDSKSAPYDVRVLSGTNPTPDIFNSATGVSLCPAVDYILSFNSFDQSGNARAPFSFKWTYNDDTPIGANIDDSTAQNPTFQNVPVGPKPIKVTVYDSLGCTGTDQIAITVNDFFNRVETLGGQDVGGDTLFLCQAVASVQANIITGTGGTYNYTWTEYGGGAATEVTAGTSPVFTNTVTKTFVLETEEVGPSCILKDTVTVKVYPNPVVDFGTDTLFACKAQRDTAQISVTGAPAFTYNWTMNGNTVLNKDLEYMAIIGDDSIQYWANATIQLSQQDLATEYTLQVVDANGCISNTDKIIIHTYNDPIFNPIYNFAWNGDTVKYCVPKVISTGLNDLEYDVRWDTSGVLVNNSADYMLPTSDAFFDVMATHRRAGCTATKLFNYVYVNVPDTSQLNLLANTAGVCENDALLIGAKFDSTIFDYPSIFSWSNYEVMNDNSTNDLGVDGFLNGTEKEQYAEYQGEPDINRAKLVLKVEMYYDCFDNTVLKKEKSLNFEATPINETSMSKMEVFIGDTISYINQGSTYEAGAVLEIRDSLGMLTSTTDAATFYGSISNYNFSFDNVGVDTVSTILRNTNGCKDEKTFVVDVIANQLVYVPNVFSPSSMNADNSSFRVFGTNIVNQDFSMTVFDRSGNIVYTTTDYYEASKIGWNGYFENNGYEAHPGVYSYLVNGTFLNGETFAKSGTVTLLR